LEQRAVMAQFLVGDVGRGGWVRGDRSEVREGVREGREIRAILEGGGELFCGVGILYLTGWGDVLRVLMKSERLCGTTDEAINT
jgi:hypothetical protein